MPRAALAGRWDGSGREYGSVISGPSTGIQSDEGEQMAQWMHTATPPDLCVLVSGCSYEASSEARPMPEHMQSNVPTPDNENGKGTRVIFRVRVAVLEMVRPQVVWSGRLKHVEPNHQPPP